MGRVGLFRRGSAALEGERELDSLVDSATCEAAVLCCEQQPVSRIARAGADPEPGVASARAVFEALVGGLAGAMGSTGVVRREFR